MTNERFDRNIRFFGEEGQNRLRNTHVAVVGMGGLGTHVVQQLALLGVGTLTVIDGEELDVSNKNRYIGSRFDDPVPGTPKTAIAERLVRSIDPFIGITCIQEGFISEAGFDAVTRAQYVFGCVDKEGVRLILAQL